MHSMDSTICSYDMIFCNPSLSLNTITVTNRPHKRTRTHGLVAHCLSRMFSSIVRRTSFTFSYSLFSALALCMYIEIIFVILIFMSSQTLSDYAGKIKKCALYAPASLLQISLTSKVTYISIHYLPYLQAREFAMTAPRVSYHNREAIGVFAKRTCNLIINYRTTKSLLHYADALRAPGHHAEDYILDIKLPIITFALLRIILTLRPPFPRLALSSWLHSHITRSARCLPTF